MKWALVLVLLLSACGGNAGHTPTKHCQYVYSKDTNPNSPYFGMTRGSWVCKTY